VLHASLVTIDHYGVAFLGETGWGKSTLAASFNRPGSEVITDDCILLNTTGETAYVTPSYTGVRLFEDSIEKLVPNHSEAAGKMSHYSVKKRMPISQSLQKKTHLHAMFFLNDPRKDEHKEANKVQKMHNLEVLPQLIRHGFSLDIEDRYRQERQLEQLGNLFKCGIVFFKLRYKRNYDELPQLQKSIREAITENSM